MNCSEAIGGYFSLACASAPGVSDRFTYLNSGHNCLRALIEALKLKALQLPYYTCPIIWKVVMDMGIEIIPYEVDDELCPLKFDAAVPMLWTNYFGVCGDFTAKLAKRKSNLLVDNAQAFYAPPQGQGAFYSPRKFFGVPDGGLAWPAIEATATLPQDISWERSVHLLKRIDEGASAAYEDFQACERELEEEPPKRMSRLTRTLLNGVDIEDAKTKRLSNFEVLHKHLGGTNLLKLNLSDQDVPMVYPYRTDETGLRSKLIDKHIYVATYWREDGFSECMKSAQAQSLANTIIPLPVDQRYGQKDMERILGVILG